MAGPLLAKSEHINDETLIVGAKTKSQEHLLAISQRALLSEQVTDALVEFGDRQVVINVAGNTGARFSQFGYSTLVTRSENDDELALKIWQRPGIPREHLLALFSTASDAVRSKLETIDPRQAALVREMSNGRPTRSKRRDARAPPNSHRRNCVSKRAIGPAC